MLRLDFACRRPLGGRMVQDEEQRRELVHRLFYLITSAAEDAAAIAVEGQSTHASALALREIAARLRSAGELIEIVSSAVEALGASAGESTPEKLENEVAPER